MELFVIVIYIIKEFFQPKMSLNREFLILKEGGVERKGVCGRVSRQSYFRFGLGLGEIEWRDR